MMFDYRWRLRDLYITVGETGLYELLTKETLLTQFSVKICLAIYNYLPMKKYKITLKIINTVLCPSQLII